MMNRMPSRRFAEALKIAADLPEEERAALAEELWNTVPDELSPASEAELRQRLAEMDAAGASGASPGLVLTIDEAIARARRPGDDTNG